jgi:hypothetical protein
MKIKLMNIGALAIIAGLWLASCSSSAHVEKVKGTDLTTYKTYSWIEPEKDSSGKSNERLEIAQQNIRAAVNDELQKNGLREVKSKPDVLVSTDLVVEKNQREQHDPVYTQAYTRSYYNPYTRRFNTFYFPSQFAGYNSYSTPVKEGTVTVTIIDAKTDKAVWQGWSTEELDQAYISDKEINKNVKSIFKKFDYQQ